MAKGGHDRVTKDGKWFFKQIAELEKLQVRVGFQYGKATDEETGVDVADIAMMNELGTERIPSRPFMRQSVDGNAARINAMCKGAVRSITSKQASARDVLQKIGVMQKGLVQATIRDGNFVPNAPATIRKKTVRGKAGTQPLIDTGRMRQSVNFVIVPKD